MAFVLGVCWILAAYPAAFAKEKAADLWVEQKGVELLAERQADGDSFGMKVQTPADPDIGFVAVGGFRVFLVGRISRRSRTGCRDPGGGSRSRAVSSVTWVSPKRR